MITIKMTAPEDAVPFNIPLLIKGSERAVEETNNDTLKSLDGTKKDFSSESQFAFQVQHATHKGNSVSASTSTDNENWIRLDRGTEDHVVGARGQLMSFQPIYRPKTRPFTLCSRPGGPDGPLQAARGPWRVRGIEPRAFILTAYTLNRPKFFRRIDRAFHNASRVR